jgi:hypothetical protein
MKTTSFLIALALLGSVRWVDAQVRLPDDRYNEYGRPGWSGHVDRRSFALSRVIDARRPRTLLNVNQSLDTVAVRSLRGTVFVRRISVEFGNHNVVDYPVNARLRPGEAKTIDVRGRRVSRVEVRTDPRWRGSFQVLGTPGYRHHGPPIGRR